MATPQPSSKRHLDAADESLRTRKAPRLDDGPTGIDAILSTLQTSIRALRAIDPSTFDTEQYERANKHSEDLGDAVELIYVQRMAVANPPPEETPVPFDHLVQVLSHLGAEDLARAAQVSRHFKRAVPEAVRHCLDNIVRLDQPEGHFEMHFSDTYTPELLKRVLDEDKIVPGLLDQITTTQSRSDFDAMMRQLEEIHSEVIYLHNPAVWDKLDVVQGLLMSIPEDDYYWYVGRRTDVLTLLDRANIPEEELGDRVDALVAALEDNEVPALSLIGQMPAAAIHKHRHTLVSKLNQENMDPINAMFARYALQALRKLPPATLVLLAKVKIERLSKLKGFNDHVRELRELALEVLKGLP